MDDPLYKPDKPGWILFDHLQAANDQQEMRQRFRGILETDDPVKDFLLLDLMVIYREAMRYRKFGDAIKAIERLSRMMGWEASIDVTSAGERIQAIAVQFMNGTEDPGDSGAEKDSGSGEGGEADHPASREFPLGEDLGDNAVLPSEGAPGRADHTHDPA